MSPGYGAYGYGSTMVTGGGGNSNMMVVGTGGGMGYYQPTATTVVASGGVAGVNNTTLITTGCPYRPANYMAIAVVTCICCNFILGRLHIFLD